METNIILMWKITIFIFNSKLQFDGRYKIWDQAETNTSFFSDLSVLVNSEVFISRIKKKKVEDRTHIRHVRWTWLVLDRQIPEIEKLTMRWRFTAFRENVEIVLVVLFPQKIFVWKLDKYTVFSVKMQSYNCYSVMYPNYVKNMCVSILFRRNDI